MKTAAYSRRLRNAHLHGDKQKKSFFSKFSQLQEHQQPFFSTRQASGHTVQTKLTIGKAGDQYEQEADQVANRVVAQSSDVQRQETGMVQRASLMSQPEDEQLGTAEARMEKDKLIQEKVQRMEEQEEVRAKPEEEVQMKSEEEEVQAKAEEEEVQMMPEEEEVQAKAEEEEVQMMPEEEEVQAKAEEEEVQMKSEEEEVQAKVEEEEVQAKQEEDEVQAKAEAGQTASAAVSQKIESSAGGGQPLSKAIRSWLERAFGADFSKVRIHTGAEAVRLNKKLGAQAFTRGRDIFFNAGKYRPETRDGKRLLAHELTHVVQQCGRKPANAQQEMDN